MRIFTSWSWLVQPLCFLTVSAVHMIAADKIDLRLFLTTKADIKSRVNAQAGSVHTQRQSMAACPLS
jgi:hypothetical protein